MTSFTVTSGLMLTILFLALSYKTQSAPAHHLTIGVQGNTPTLIVTSSEVGITPAPLSGNSPNSKQTEYSDKVNKATAVEKKFLMTGAQKNQTLFNKKIKLPHLRKPFAKSFPLHGNVTNSSETNQNLHRPLNQSTKSILELDLFNIKATSPATPGTTESVESYKTNSPSTTFTRKQINDIPLISFATPQVNTALGENITENSSTTIPDDENLHISPVESTTLDPHNFEDTTITLKYHDEMQAATQPVRATATTTTTYANDVVTQTPKTTQKLPNRSDITIETKAVADGRTKDTIPITENKNLLFTTIGPKGLTTPSTPALASMATDGAEATTGSELSSLSLTMATTIIEDNSNNMQRQQLAGAEHKDKEIYGPPKEPVKEKEIEEKNIDKSMSANTRENHTLASIRLAFTEPKSTENPLKDQGVKFAQESLINAAAKEPIKIKTSTKTEKIKETHTTTTEATTQQQEILNKLKTSQKQEETTTITNTSPLNHHSEFATSTTTEAVLKLIDLEKHVLKTIEELKQPTLLMAGQHDNGHDGLKNIKKKQLIDKHYVEALLHNKQDHHTKPSIKSEKNSLQRTQTSAKNFDVPLNSSDSTKSSKKPVLMSAKHGYLGPILMEEKTFHVIHHASDNSVFNENHHVDDVESQLRKGHFVELKAKKDVETNKTIKSSVERSKEMLEMQSDQPSNIPDKDVTDKTARSKHSSSAIKAFAKIKNNPQDKSTRTLNSDSKQPNSSTSATILIDQETNKTYKHVEAFKKSKSLNSLEEPRPEMIATTIDKSLKNSFKVSASSIAQTLSSKTPLKNDGNSKLSPVLSTTVFQVADTLATQTPIVQADTLFTAEHKEKSTTEDWKKTESKISDIQIEIYDSTVDSIVASTNFKDIDSGNQSSHLQTDESYLGKTTKPPVSVMQQERFTQYVIDRMETSTPEPINYSTIQVASGKPEPAAIEIHINVSESFGNEGEDVEFSYPQAEYISNNNSNNGRTVEELYDDNKISDSIKLKIPSNSNGNGRELKNDEILVVEVIDTDNNTAASLKGKPHNTDDLFISDVKDIYTTPPPPPPPPPFQTSFDRDSDTIFYISNTEVKVGESLPATKNVNEERKLKLESQFFPANYMASTHPNLNKGEDSNPTHHLYEEDIIVSSNHNEADSLKIYRNNNEPAPPLDVTYVGESIIEVEQSPETVITTTFAPNQQRNAATPQPDVVIQPAILPEISIGVPVIGELPPQIELKEIDFMPNEPQLHRSGIYDDNDNTSNNNLFSNDIDENTINGSNNNHDVEVASSNSNSNQRVDESSIQYGGDLIDESADGGFDGVEGSYPFSNPATGGKSFTFASPSSYASSSSAFLTNLQKQQQQPNHVADFTHLYVNYGVSNMRKDELSADIKDLGEMLLLGSSGNGNEQNFTSSKGFLNKVSTNNSTVPFMSTNSTQSERMSNATAFSLMEDANDLEDKNTEDIINLISLGIGLFIVILPVVVTCSMFWALRYLYNKYHSNIMDSEGYADQTETKGALNGDDLEKGEFIHETFSPSTNIDKAMLEKYPDTSNKPSNTIRNVNLSNEELTPHIETTTTFETNNKTNNISSINISTKLETVRLTLPLTSPITRYQSKQPPSASSSTAVATTRQDIHSDDGIKDDNDDDDDGDEDVEMSGPNGSITKMTLENNLLIVETEERNDISRVARETKMDYNKDGVFVVEVARGIDSKTIPESPVTEGNERMLSMFDVKQNNGGLGYKTANEKSYINNEKVQIHSPPVENQEDGPRSLHQIEEVEEPINSPHLTEMHEDLVGLAYKANTGLSQSDLSSTSSSDSNKGYCYGKQELYVIEQRGYTAVTPNGNVVLKCDVKDIKDDDRNPGNDPYLRHSPDKKEEINKTNKENFVETFKKPGDGESRTGSGESPEQKQNDKVKENFEDSTVKEDSEMSPCPEIIVEDEIKEEQYNFNIEMKAESLIKNEKCAEVSKENQNISIPVEIEIHITPSVEESPEESLVLEETSNVAQPLVAEHIYEVIEECVALQLTPSNNSPRKEAIKSNDHTPTDNAGIAEEKQDSKDVTDANKARENPVFENREINGNALAEKEKEIEKEALKVNLETNGENGHCEDSEEKENSDILNQNPEMLLSNVTENKIVEFSEEDEMKKREFLKGRMQPELLVNGINDLSDALTELKSEKLQNGYSKVEENGNSLNQIENGYDSLVSLPEPPLNTDEQLNNDLSDQQLDSLPPPPPPEIFNLKDLPPPLTNGNPDSPQSEESNNFYSSLPPPPPNTMEMTGSTETSTATAGKVHASPLTPPASPPALFTNNLHAGLCSQPIAVDVNGS